MTPAQQNASIEAMQKSYNDQMCFLSNQLALTSGILAATQAELAVEKAKNEKTLEKK